MSTPKGFPRFSTWCRPSDYAKPGDASLGAGLADIVQTCRAAVWRLSDEPKRAQVRETLRRLSLMGPDEAAAQWSSLDPWTRAEIKREHHKQFRQRHDDGAPYRSAFDRRGPENLPELADKARRSMLASTGGRTEVTHIYIRFAADLAAYFWHEKDCQPTTWGPGSPDSPFTAWAREVFGQADVPTGDLAKILADGVLQAKQQGRIPSK